MFDCAVLVGRFQPFHRGHEALAAQGLELAHRLVCVIGSAGELPSVRNPWSLAERIAMMEQVLPAGRVSFVGVQDSAYDFPDWVRRVRQAVIEREPAAAKVVLVGHEKDATSFYLKHFPEWHYRSFPLLEDGVGATAVRRAYFGFDGRVPDELLSGAVVRYLQAWKAGDLYARLAGYYRHCDLVRRPEWGDGRVHEALFVLCAAGKVRLLEPLAGGQVDGLRLPGRDLVEGQGAGEVKAGLLGRLGVEAGAVPVMVREFAGPGRHPVQELVSLVSLYIYDAALPVVVPEMAVGGGQYRVRDYPLSGLAAGRGVFFEDHGRIVQCLVRLAGIEGEVEA